MLCVPKGPTVQNHCSRLIKLASLKPQVFRDEGLDSRPNTSYLQRFNKSHRKSLRIWEEKRLHLCPRWDMSCNNFGICWSMNYLKGQILIDEHKLTVFMRKTYYLIWCCVCVYYHLASIINTILVDVFFTFLWTAVGCGSDSHWGSPVENTPTGVPQTWP